MVESSKSSDSESPITNFLNSAADNEDGLYGLVYENLKAIARNRLSNETPGELNATALVNEAYLRLTKQKCTWQNRRQFFAMASKAMSRILIDEARSRKSMKRGGDLVRHSLSGIGLLDEELKSWDADLLELDEALGKLEIESPDHAELIRLKFFSGLTFNECATVLETSLSTVERRWRFARAWLRAKIEEK